MSIRCAAKAVILKNGKVLLNKNKNSLMGEYYDLPGGGQHQGETMQEAVRRECLEETGYVVSVGRFLALCEEIWDDEAMKVRYPDHVHKIYHIFECRVEDDEKRAPTEADIDQVGFAWVPVEEIAGIELYPRPFRSALARLLASGASEYLGLDRASFKVNAE